MDRKKPSFFYRVFVFAVTAVVSISAVAVLAVGLLVYRVSQNADVYETAQTAALETDAAASEEELDDIIPVIAQPIAQQGYTHILIIGTDREESGISRADVIMVCSIDEVNNKMVISSFLRDLYLPIPGYEDNRINASYAYGGAELLKKCLAYNFGISVDHTVEIDFEGFSSIIDALNGVELELNDDEAAYLGLLKGKQKLNGAQALQYVRIRAVGNGDFDRTLRQQKLMSAIGLKFTNANIGSMYQCIKRILGHIKTDMDIGDILGLLPNIIRVVGNKQCKSLQIPDGGSYQETTISGMQVLLPDVVANREKLIENFE